jgi:hypothetical protein
MTGTGNDSFRATGITACLQAANVTRYLFRFRR